MIDKLLFTLPGIHRAVATCAVCSFLMAGSVIGMSLSFAYALSSLMAGLNAASQAHLIVIGACFVAARAIVSSVERSFIETYAKRTAGRLREQLLESVYDRGPSFVREKGTGAVVSTAIDGASHIETYLRIIVPKMAAIVIVPLVLLVFLFPVDWVSGVIALVAFPFIILYMIILGSNAKREAETRYVQFNELANHFLDSLRGIRTLKLFGASERRSASIFRTSEQFRDATMKTLRTATFSNAVLDLFATGALAAVAIMLGFRLVDGTMALLPALIVLIAIPEYFRPVREFAADYHATLDGKTALAETLGIIEETRPEHKSADVSPWSDDSKLSLENVSVSFDNVPALNGASLELRGFARVAIVGKSGAGKSTLASVLAGFITPDSGTIRIDGSTVGTLAQDSWRSHVLYIPQHPYVFHASLHDNISFYRPSATRSEVENAARLAGLDTLIHELPQGLDTIIGEGGRDLSGGEQQRIAIARALVDRDRRVIIFDEPTAHLDIETEYDLKERMLPLMKDRLVIFATHRLHWLNDMDTVIELDHGRISSVRPGGRGANLSHQNAASASAHYTLPSDDRAHLTAHIETPEHRKGRSTPELQTASSQNVSASYENHEATAQADPNRRSRARRDRWVLPYLARYKRALALALILGVLTYGFAAALMVTSGYLVSASSVAETILALHLPLLAVRIFGIGKPFLGYVERLVSHNWVLKMTSLLRLDLFRAAEISTLASASAQRTGNLLGLLSDDIEHLQNLYLRTIFPAIVAWAVYAALIVIFGVLSPLIAALLALSIGLVVFALPAFSVVVNGAREARRSALRKAIYADVTDNVLGIEDWTYSGRRDDYLKRFESAYAEEARLADRTDTFSRCADAAAQIVLSCSLVAIALWAAARFSGNDPWLASWIAAFTIGFFPLIDVFAGVPQAALGSISHRESIARLNSLPNPASTSRSDDTATIDLPSHPDIVFDTVSFAYDAASKLVLNRLDIRIPFKQKIAVLGKSGVGKSTLTSLLRGDLIPTAGSVRIGSIDPTTLGNMTPQLVGVVQQNTYLFHGTVLDNLRIGNPHATEQEALAAINAVGLTRRLAELDGGLYAHIDEAGTNLSGGERHRLALARVLLVDPPIVVLDEPCAGLDPDTERSLLETFFTVLANRTVIMITHHLAGARLADRIVFLENGSIAEENGRPVDGAPDELAQQSERYARLLAFDAGR